MHAWHQFWVNSWPTTANSKPDSPWIPACLRSVTSGLRGTSVTVRGIGVLNKWLKCATELNLCFLRRHVDTNVTWSPWLPFMISFQLNALISLTHFEDVAAMEMAARATAARVRNSKHQSNHCHTKPATGSHLLIWRYKLILNWYVGA